MTRTTSKYVSTTNACKLCKPMGACLAFRGIEGAVPFLHGSQGCATYMRRYIISHFNEPMDIASSSLGEKHAVYGGAANLKQGLRNVASKFVPKVVGIATTCLTETIGDDVSMILKEYYRETGAQSTRHPIYIPVSTPSYSGTHMEGFHAAVFAVVKNVAQGGRRTNSVNLFPGFVSPADLRYLKEVLEDFSLPVTVLPDISETLDGPVLSKYEKIPRGGTPVSSIIKMGRAMASIEFGRTLFSQPTAGEYLVKEFGVANHRLGLPIGLRETDRFFGLLEELSGRPVPKRHAGERGRFIDACVDSHKYIFGKKAIIYGEEDLVVGLTALMAEIGVRPVLCASGGKSGRLMEAIESVTRDILPDLPLIREGMDFYEIAEEAEALGPDLLVGHSKGYFLTRKRGIPLVRVGFPIHDRMGGQRILHLGYRGGQTLLDRVVNAIIQKKQDESPVGYTYM